MYYFDRSALVELTQEKSQGRELLGVLETKQIFALVSASLAHLLPTDLVDSFYILSVSGREARETIAEDDPANAQGLLAARRSAPGAMIVSRENLERALTNLRQLEPGKINMLDLGREYIQQAEGLDHRTLGFMASSRYVLGPEVAQLEREICDYTGAAHGVGCSSGTEALILGLRALALQRTGREYFSPEDKILTTSFTFTATGDTILRSGATPVFLDIDPVTFNLDVKELRRYLEEQGSEGVVGIMPVHLYGGAADMEPILALAREYNLFVVEDVAQGFGGKYGDQYLGTMGDIGTYSFFPTKNLGGMGDGGMVVTPHDELNEILRMLIKHGGRDKYNVDHIGYNARLDTMQAAILLERLRWIKGYTEKRQALAAQYDRALQHLPIQAPQSLPQASHCYHQYTMRVHENRDALKDHLAAQGVSSMIYYPVPLHEMKVFIDTRGESFGKLPVTMKAVREVLSLPMEPLQRKDETARLVRALGDFYA